MRLWDTEQPRAVVVGWDTLESPTYRHEELPGYQAGRVFDDAARAARDAARAGGSVRLRAARAAGYEADDFLGAAAAAERSGAARASSSRPTATPISSRRRGRRSSSPFAACSSSTGSRPAQVLEIYGVEPEQVPDFIALRGDPSDKIPGAKGVGPKTAATVLLEHGTLEAALAAGRFPNQAEDLLLYRRMPPLTPPPRSLPERPDPNLGGGVLSAREGHEGAL